MGQFEYDLSLTPYSNMVKLVNVANGKVEYKPSVKSDVILTFFEELLKIKLAIGRKESIKLCTEEIKDILRGNKTMFTEEILPVIENYVGWPVKFVRMMELVYFRLGEQILDESKQEKQEIFFSLHSQSTLLAS